MKILITGSAGFIGFHLSRSMLEKGHSVLGVDILNNHSDNKLKNSRTNILKSYDNFIFNKVDITNKELLETSYNSFNPQKVVHLAAQTGIRYSLKNPSAYIDTNIVGFSNVIQLCKINKVENFVYASSSSIYGKSQNLLFSENEKADTPISLYGATKRANELIAHSYSHLYNINTTGLRFFTVYGPWNRSDMAMFIFIKNIISNHPIEVFNNGRMERDFTYIDDIVEGIELSLDQHNCCEIFNLGNHKSEKIMNVINLIENELGQKAIINFKPIQKGDLKRTCADISYSKQKLGFEPKTSINTGIPKLVNWYKDYYNV